MISITNSKNVQSFSYIAPISVMFRCGISPYSPSFGWRECVMLTSQFSKYNCPQDSR